MKLFLFKLMRANQLFLYNLGKKIIILRKKFYHVGRNNIESNRFKKKFFISKAQEQYDDRSKVFDCLLKKKVYSKNFFIKETLILATQESVFGNELFMKRNFIFFYLLKNDKIFVTIKNRNDLEKLFFLNLLYFLNIIDDEITTFNYNSYSGRKIYLENIFLNFSNILKAGLDLKVKFRYKASKFFLEYRLIRKQGLVINKIKKQTNRQRFHSFIMKMDKNFFEFKNDKDLLENIASYSRHYPYSIYLYNKKSEKTLKLNPVKVNSLANEYEKLIFFNIENRILTKKEYAFFYQDVKKKWESPLGVIHFQKEKNGGRSVIIFIRKNMISDKNSGNFSNFLCKECDEFAEIFFQNELYLNKKFFKNSYSKIHKKKIIQKIITSLTFIFLNKNYSFHFFSRNFENSIKKIALFDKKNSLKWAHLITFFSTLSKTKGITLMRYLEKNADNEKVIYYHNVNPESISHDNPNLKKYKSEKKEVLLLLNENDEFLLKIFEKLQDKFDKKKVTFVNIETQELYLNEKNFMKNFSNKKILTWFKVLLVDRILDVKNSADRIEIISTFKLTKFGSPMSLQNHLTDRNKSGFDSFRKISIFSKILELNTESYLLKVFEKSLNDKEFLIIKKQISILIWEITFLRCGYSLPNRELFLERVENMLFLLLKTFSRK
jgi:HSP90 family molecular chaperone